MKIIWIVFVVLLLCTLVNAQNNLPVTPQPSPYEQQQRAILETLGGIQVEMANIKNLIAAPATPEDVNKAISILTGEIEETKQVANSKVDGATLIMALVFISGLNWGAFFILKAMGKV